MNYNYLCENKLCVQNQTENFDLQADVVVIGLGTAGAISAITAAKQGLSVIGIEKQTMLGGTQIGACVCDYYYGIRSGISDEINKISKELEEKNITKAFNHPTEYSVSLTSKSLALERLADKYGCRLMTDTLAVGAFVDDKKIVGVKVYNGEKFLNIKAEIFIDNSDGFLSKLCGCEMLKGRSSDNKTMRSSKTVCFYLDNKNIHGEWNSVDFVDDLDSFSLSEKLIENEIKPPLLLEKYSSERIPIFEGTMLGRREVSWVKTHKVITFSDVVGLKEYEHTVFYGFAPFDNVNDDLENETDNLVDWIYLSYMRHFGVSFAVPLESLVPSDLDNLIVVGKAIGLNHDTASMIRMKAEMEKCGEAAAYMAALAVKSNCLPIDVDYKKLKIMLEKSGCLKAMAPGYYSLRKDENNRYIKVDLSKTADEFEKVLSSKTPQTAFVAAIAENDQTLDKMLEKFLTSTDKTLKINSAIALGIRKNPACLPVLYDIIDDEPTVTENFNGKHYFGWLEKDEWSDYIKAIILLGRFRDKTKLKELKKISQTDYNAKLSYLGINKFAQKAVKRIEE